MGMLATTFLFTLALSFAVLVFSMRPATAGKSVRQRLTIIAVSVQKRTPDAGAAELEKAAQSDCFARFGALLERYRFSQRLGVLLIQADSSMSVGGVVLACAGAAAGSGLLCFLVWRTLLPALAATAAGAAIPYCALRIKRGSRLKAFNTALPDAIELMARSLRAGHSMGSSIELIAEQATGPLASEFVQVFQQQRLGLQFRDALLQMGGRVPSRDLQFLITAILVQKETGGDLNEILERAAHVIRERIRIEGEVRTHTAQGRLTGWILGMLPVIMLALINIVSPGYSAVLFHDPTGQKLLYAGAILIVIGGLIIRKVVDVQV